MLLMSLFLGKFYSSFLKTQMKQAGCFSLHCSRTSGCTLYYDGVYKAVGQEPGLPHRHPLPNIFQYLLS